MMFTHAAIAGNPLLRWLKFNLVGAMGTLVQVAVVSFGTQVLGMNYLLATALAVEAAVLHNFVWHDRFTWVDRSGLTVSRLGRFFRFNLTGVISVAGNLMFLSVLVEQAHLPVVSANLLAIAFCSPASYVASDRIVFRKKARWPDSPLPLPASQETDGSSGGAAEFLRR